MKKNYENKEVNSEKVFTKVLVCKKETVMPGVGHWKEGDIISDQEKIIAIADNPNFEVQKEV